MRFTTRLARALWTIAFGLTLGLSAVGNAAGVITGACPQKGDAGGLGVLADAVREARAYDAAHAHAPIRVDERATVAILLEPVFEGRRPFGQPSGVKAHSAVLWSHTALVSDAGPVTVTDLGFDRSGDALVRAGAFLHAFGARSGAIVAAPLTHLQGYTFQKYAQDVMSPVTPWGLAFHAPEYAHQGVDFVFSFRSRVGRRVAEWHTDPVAASHHLGTNAADAAAFLGSFAKGTGIAAIDDRIASARMTTRSEPPRPVEVEARPPPESNPGAKPKPADVEAEPALRPEAIPTPRGGVRHEEVRKFTTDEMKHVVKDPNEELTPSEIDRVLERNPELKGSKLSEIRVVEYEKANGYEIKAPTETTSRAELGLKSGDPICDLVKVEKSTKNLIAVEVKNQRSPHFDGQGNSVGKKFDAIAAADTTGRVKRFEVVVHNDSEMPSNFRVEPESGQVWKLVSGTDSWVPWDFGGRPVFVKRAALGVMGVD